jgi:flagellar protein FlaG
MSIQSVTANAQSAPVVQPAGKAVAQPEVKAGNLPPEAPKRAESAPESRSSNREESEKAVREAVDNIQKFVAQSTRDITFSIDQDAGFMVKVIDRSSQDVIRQIPSEEVVAIAQALDKLQGLFVRDKI